MTIARSLGVAGLSPSTRAPNLLVGAGVEIDETATIGANVVIYDGVRIGPHALIKNNCVIGESPSLAIDSHAPPQPPRETEIAAGVTVCNGVVIFTGASLGQDAIVGDQAYIREGATIAEDCVIGRGCNIAAGAIVGARTKIQNNSIVLPGMLIEEDVFVGASVSGATDHSMGSRRPPSRR